MLLSAAAAPVVMVIAVAALAALSVDALPADYHWDWEDGSLEVADDVPILEQSFQMNLDGSHRWSFTGADGSERWEEGSPSAGVRGGYGYSGGAGDMSVQYVADQHGFQPWGDAIHPDIVRAVALQVAKAREEPEGMWDERGFPVFGFHDY